MRSEENGLLRFAELREQVGEVLSTNANRLKMIEATMVSATPLLLYMTLFSTYRAVLLPFFEAREGILTPWLCRLGFWGFVSALTLLFTLPLLSGLLYMAREMEAGAEVELPDVFHAFSGGGAYREALRISWQFLWRVALLLLCEELLYGLFDLVGLWDSGFGWIADLLMLTVFAAWMFFVGLRGFLSAYLTLQPRQVRARMRRLSLGVGFWYWIRWIPWLLLSLLTFCILLLADVLPRMLICYYRVCRIIKENTEQSEEDNHE